MSIVTEHDKSWEDKLNALRQWIYRFMRKHNFSFKRITHKYKAKQNAQLRLEVVSHLNNMIKINLDPYHDFSVFNMDEVPIYLSTMSNYT